MALILFGALFVLLFIGFAIAQGLTGPSVPSGDAAHVSDVPSEFSNVSEEKLKRSIIRRATSQGGKLPKPGSEKYEELQDQALAELIEGVWIRGQAEEFGLTVTDKQIEDELETVKKQNFPSDGAYEKFLKKSNFSQEEVNELLELQIFTQQVEGLVNAQTPPPSQSEIETYYEAEKESKYTKKESRDVRAIVNKDKAKVDAALRELEKDNSPASWEKVAPKYSIDPTSKSKGGLQEGITEQFVKGPLKVAIFDKATGELSGPIKFEDNYILIEVVKLNPQKIQNLGEVRSQIVSTLGQEKQQEFFSEFIADFNVKWTERTTCAEGFVIEKCSNYVGDGRPSNAPPACYEANPKAPALACPAPVTPISPALPGSVSESKPKGERFPQRPLPEATPAAAGAEEVPGGVPPGAAPSGE